MKQKRIWKIDEEVVVLFEEVPYRGTIVEVGTPKTRVLFDDGEDLMIANHKIQPYQVEIEADDVKDRDKESNVGFNQFNIHWDKIHVNFKFKAEGGQFWGWWRKCGRSGSKVFAIDIHVNYKDVPYNVTTIHYQEVDPREDLYSLESDICAACNKWFYYKANCNFATLEDLKQKAEKPIIRINKIQALDQILIDLKVFRDTAIRCGGRRTLRIDGTESTPDALKGLFIEVDFTTQAMGLKGRVPTLHGGTVLDVATSKTGRKQKAGRGERSQAAIKVKSSPENIKQILTQLQNSKDKTEKRKLRALLRRMGHKGGARSAK